MMDKTPDSPKAPNSPSGSSDAFRQYFEREYPVLAAAMSGSEDGSVLSGNEHWLYTIARRAFNAGAAAASTVPPVPEAGDAAGEAGDTQNTAGQAESVAESLGKGMLRQTCGPELAAGFYALKFLAGAAFSQYRK